MLWLKRISVALIVAVVAILCIGIGIGSAWQAWSMARDAERLPMPGVLVDAGGHKLHLYCSGQGTPLVLLENGLGADYTAWQRVQPAVAKFTRVCSYDRAGMGWSEPANNPTRAQYVVADLHRLLTNAGIHGPMILVGWSAGGLFARRYVHDYPSGIVGLVLVESSHEQQGWRLPKLPNQDQAEADQNRTLTLCRYTQWTGLERALGIFEKIAVAQHFDGALRDAFVAMANQSDFCAGIQQENTGFPADVQSKAQPASLGALPLVVLTRGKPMLPSDLPFRARVDDLRKTDAAWFRMQAELATLSSHSTQRRVAGSGHAIPLDRPDVLVAALREMAAAR